MTHPASSGRDGAPPSARRPNESSHRLLADGGRETDEATADTGENDVDEENDDVDEESDDADGENDAANEQGDSEGREASGVDESNVTVTETGTAEPADPKWEPPDLDDIPEVDGPKTRPAQSRQTDDELSGESGGTPRERDAGASGDSGEQSDDPTAGMPNTARSPGQSRLKEEGVDGYVAALELCARLPDEVRLPEEAADLVPVALEAELEQDVQSFAAEEFGNPTPHVDTLDFVEADGELWLRLRLGVDPGSFADLDTEAIQDHALQQIDRLL